MTHRPTTDRPTTDHRSATARAATARSTTGRSVHPAAARPTAYRSSTARRLDREWSRLRRRPEAVRRAAGWRLVEGDLQTLDDVLHAAGYDRPGSPEAERVLGQLVALAATDELAARIVVQRLLPGLVSIVHRRRRHSDGDPVDEVVGAAWLAVRTFNQQRRPACLAAALIADADHLAFRAAARRKSAGELPIDHTAITVVAPERDDGLRELFELVRMASLPDDDVRLIRELVTHTTVEEAAAALHVTARTVRNRRARLTAHLRALAAA